MSIFSKFTHPRGDLSLKFDKESFDYNEELTGKLIINPKEDFQAESLCLEITPVEKTHTQHYESSNDVNMVMRALNSQIHITRDVAFEQPFRTQIPFKSMSYPFTQVELRVRGVVWVKGRHSLTCELVPKVNYPYIVECRREFGGCGWVSESSLSLISECPGCGLSLQRIWDAKAKALEEQARAVARSHKPMMRRR